MLSEGTIESILTGVVQGLLLALILGAYHFVTEFLKKKAQRKYLNDIINDNLIKIFYAEDLEPPYQGAQPIPADAVRRTFYEYLYRLVDSFLSDSTASNKITHQAKEKIRSPFNTINWAMNQADKKAGEGLGRIEGIKPYRNVLLESLKEIEWIELDKRFADWLESDKLK